MSSVRRVRPSTEDLNVVTFDHFLPSLEESAATGDSVCIELSDLRFIDLFAAMALLHWCEGAISKYRCPIRLELSEAGACSFLPRLGFLSVLPENVQISGTPGPAKLQWQQALRGTNPTFLEITRLDSHDVIDEVLAKLITIVFRNLHYPKREALDMAQAFSEVCRNVLDHNELSAQGMAAMQICSNKEGRYLQFVVSDRGAGIRATLSRNPELRNLSSDKRAIIQSTALGVSEYHQNEFRGNGLYHLLRLVSKHEGSVHIRSGEGRVYWSWGRYGERRYPYDVPFLGGVQVALRFPARNQTGE